MTLYEDTLTGTVYEFVGEAASESRVREQVVLRRRADGELTTVPLYRFNMDVTVLRHGVLTTAARFQRVVNGTAPVYKGVTPIPSAEEGGELAVDEIAGVDDVPGTGH